MLPKLLKFCIEIIYYKKVVKFYCTFIKQTCYIWFIKFQGASTSMTPLDNLYKKFEKELNHKDKVGSLRDWNVDLVPKFLMAQGKLVKLLVHTNVTR